LKATNPNTAIGKYPTGQTPIFKEKKFQLLWRYWKQPKITILLPRTVTRKFSMGAWSLYGGLTF